jgi:hypothetical protein
MAVRRQPGKPYYNERKSGLIKTDLLANELCGIAECLA